MLSRISDGVPDTEREMGKDPLDIPVVSTVTIAIEPLAATVPDAVTTPFNAVRESPPGYGVWMPDAVQMVAAVVMLTAVMVGPLVPPPICRYRSMPAHCSPPLTETGKV